MRSTKKTAQKFTPKNNHLSRRDFLRILTIGSTALVGNQILSACTTPAAIENTAGTNIPPLPDVEISIKAIKDSVSILSGKPTSVLRYQGEVINGPGNALILLPDSYLGPIFNLNTGQHVRVHFKNDLSEKSIIHWHGLHVPVEADGHPRLAIEPGETYIYDFTVADRAGTYWYHPHPHGRTGPQVYAGLAGLFIISDKEESSLHLPSGEFDVPLVIQDRIFDDNNQLVYDKNDMMDKMMGFLGNRILVNGQAEYHLNAATRPYRFRLLNGSNSRIYKLAWEDGTPLTVMATDGGLLEKPISKEYITLAPGQRIELWVDFSHRSVGSQLRLVNLPGATPGGNASFPILTAIIDRVTTDQSKLPDQLTKMNLHDRSKAVNTADPREFRISMGHGMTWLINGKTFDMNDVSSDEIVRLGDVELWEFSNQRSSGMGMGMQLPHPMHIHGLQFQILERQVDSAAQAAWSSVSGGYVDAGWHDTVLVMPGERVKILLKFEDFVGIYLYHCHNLEHEDMGMMRNYRVDA